MPSINPCQWCETGAGVFVISDKRDGETVIICHSCLPVFASAQWEDAGLPELRFDFDMPEDAGAKEDAGAAEPEPPPRRAPARARKRRGPDLSTEAVKESMTAEDLAAIYQLDQSDAAESDIGGS